MKLKGYLYHINDRLVDEMAWEWVYGGHTLAASIKTKRIAQDPVTGLMYTEGTRLWVTPEMDDELRTAAFKTKMLKNVGKRTKQFLEDVFNV